MGTSYKFSKRRKTLSCGIVLILFVSTLIWPIPEDVSGADPTVQDVQDLIDDINATLADYSGTLLSLITEEDDSSIPALDRTQKVLNDAVFAISHYDNSMNLYSSYQPLITEIYDNLTLIWDDLYGLQGGMDNLISISGDWTDACQDIEDYIISYYHPDDYDEDDYNGITVELLADPNFMGLLQTDIDITFDYIWEHNDVMDTLSKISGTLYSSTRNHYYLWYSYYSAATQSKSSQNSTSTNKTQTNSTASSSENSSSSSSSKSSSDPLKMVTHNYEVYANQGAWKAIKKAQDMEMDYIRMDYRWDQLYKEDEYKWDVYNDPLDYEDNWWDDILVLNNNFISQRSMETFCVIDVMNAPLCTYDDFKDEYEANWEDCSEYMPADKKDDIPELTRAEASLWASWAENHLFGFNIPGPNDYVEELLEELSDEIDIGFTEIAGFQILNEPNIDQNFLNWFTWGRVPDNWHEVEIPYMRIDDIVYQTVRYIDEIYGNLVVERYKKIIWGCAFITYTTMDYMKDLLKTVKINTDLDPNLDQTVTVVNPYVAWNKWKEDEWYELAEYEYLDIIGADIYYDQTSAKKTSIKTTSEVANDVGKPWWIVETAGSFGPGSYKFSQLVCLPSTTDVDDFADKCENKDVAVMGWYKLWGKDPATWSLFDYNNAYNIWRKPGENPEATYDGWWFRTYYWQTIRDVWD